MNTIDATREFQGQFLAVRPSTKYLVVHHAAANYAPVNGIDDVRAIARYHVQTRGWAGIGYHEVLAELTPGGPIACYVVSNPLSIRAHTWGRNHEAWGITMAADFTRTIPPQKWIDALALRLVEAKRRWATAQIVGHKDITFKGHETSCPGEKWPEWRTGLLAQVEAMLRQTAPPAARAYKVLGLPIYQRQDLTGPLAGHLADGETILIDATYPNGAGHDKLGRGFVDMQGLEAL